jgi:predicted nucleotidyltransferase
MDGPWLTLKERKARKLAALHDGVARLKPLLAERARALGGRYLLFGSAATGLLHEGSDVDLLLDFPEEVQCEAWRFAEEACWGLGLKPDIMPLGWSRERFLARVLPEAVVLG